ncbi:MAG TPA: DNA mismatch repair protein MutS [Saprospiraceae bacterium]|nr:DNA mismatch repair protein MutS [Saprospiraceae bacterium]
MKGQNLLFDQAPLTPLMEQYYQLKAQHPDAILLYRVGDFYETFGTDAVATSKVLGIVLTARNNGGTDVELAGFPFHSLDAYLPKLVRAGYRVAICEQLEKPSKGKKVVKRGITDVITPGVTTDEKLLDFRKNNFLACLSFSNEIIGISFADISTGEFYLSEGSLPYIQKLIQNFQPSEILLARSKRSFFETEFGEHYYAYYLEDWIFQSNFAKEKLYKHFQVSTLKGFGVEEFYTGQIAAGTILHYLETTQNRNPKHLSKLSRIASDDSIWMDRFTIRNLELVDSLHQGTSLIEVLDQTKTPMGSRMLRKWVLMPLINGEKINARLNAISHLIFNESFNQCLEEHLNSFGDLERLVSKIPLRRISPREILHIKNSLNKLQPIIEQAKSCDDPLISQIQSRMHSCKALVTKILDEFLEDAPNTSSKGGIFKNGISPELDELRQLMTNGKDMLVEIQKEEALKTGIANLKIGYNSVFGYFLEVTNKYKNQDLIPQHWVRKQTMSTGERYVTDELKKLESKILGAEERSLSLEEELYQKFLNYLQDEVLSLQANAQAIAELDCLLALATIAQKNHYCRPQIDDSLVIDIKSGRHPVIEKQLSVTDSYIPNDVYLDDHTQQILMITGPNMSGKSALLRQTALICIMAQIGSYVPATEARLGVLDRIFTRVGASDNISSGESTFMVEMNETASILNNLSNRSLILLDEIGRGTSTYDGISIAWSIAEFLHETSSCKAKTLFATHYHELNELANHYSRIKNFHVSTQEIDNKVIFLRKLVQGGSEHSFGIHVAQMAGMPQEVISRAEEILTELESLRSKNNSEEKLPSQKANQLVLSIVDAHPTQDSEVINELQLLDLQTMTPIECMMKIIEWKKKIQY